MAEQKPNVVVALTPGQAAARTIAEEMAAKKEAGIVLNETRPGGYFLREDGVPIDSEGREIKDGGEEKVAAKKTGKK